MLFHPKLKKHCETSFHNVVEDAFSMTLSTVI